MNLDQLRAEYDALEGRLDRACGRLANEFKQLLEDHSITPAVPVEKRVKDWESIADKIDRKSLILGDLTELQDLVGFRLILLFERDLDKLERIISERFTIVTREDTAERLGTAHFGYRSLHHIVRLPKDWLGTPTLKILSDFDIELQIRTLAQHMWAEASHQLQYKQKQSVPESVKRSMSLAAALLEAVDVTFERVFTDREQYQGQIDLSKTDSALNVDLVARVLDELLPADNRKEVEPYADLVDDLREFGITTSGELRDLVQKHLPAIMARDVGRVQKMKQGAKLEHMPERTKSRLERGVFFSHVALARYALKYQFGARWKRYQNMKRGS